MGCRRPWLARGVGLPDWLRTVLQVTCLSLGATAYATALVVKLPGFLLQMVPTSDTISPGLLVNAIGSPGAGAVYLGNHNGFSNLLVAAFALRLPNHLVSPQAVTYSTYLLGALLLAWTVRRLGGWRAAAISALVSIAATPALLVNESSPAGRVTSLLNLALLGWLAMLLFSWSRSKPRSAVAAALAVGVVSGVDAASDPLFVVVGIVPLLLTGLVLWLRIRDRASAVVALGTVAMVAATAASALLTLAVAGALRLHSQPNPVSLNSFAGAVYTLHLMGGDTGEAIGGIFTSLGSGITWYLEAGVAVLVCAAVAAALIHAGRLLGAEPRVVGRDGAGTAHAVFWSLVAAADVTAFLATSYAVDLTSIRYLTPLLMAFAALIPMVGGRRPWGRTVLVIAVSGVACANAWALASLSLPTPVQRGPLVTTLEAAHVTHAYADYWDANIITWATKGGVAVRPVVECGSDGRRLCPELVNAARGWYGPTTGPVAVIVDPRHPLSQPPSPTYAPPQRVVHVGDIAIYLYAHYLRLTPSP